MGAHAHLQAQSLHRLCAPLLPLRQEEVIVNATAALTAVPSEETFGLRHNQDRLIAKLRQLPPDILATLPTRTKEHTA
jgi:hypothetical protein